MDGYNIVRENLILKSNTGKQRQGDEQEARPDPDPRICSCLRPVKHEEQTTAGNSGREWIKLQFLCSWERTAEMTTNGSSMKAEPQSLLIFSIIILANRVVCLNHPIPGRIPPAGSVSVRVLSGSYSKELRFD